MTPAKQSDLKSYFAPKFNFGINLGWIAEICLVTLSVLAYYYRVFQDLINDKKAKAMIWFPFLSVLVWAGLSVSTPHLHNSTRSHTSTIQDQADSGRWCLQYSFRVGLQAGIGPLVQMELTSSESILQTRHTSLSVYGS